MNAALAITFAAIHGLVIAWLVVGGPVSCRYPSLARAHLLTVVAIAGVFLVGAGCPLTVAENHFRAAAGWETHDTGFVSHYLVEPWHPSGITPLIRVGLVAAWVLPSVVGHGLRMRKTAPLRCDGGLTVPDPSSHSRAGLARG